MAYKNGVVSVGTTATLIATPSSAPENGGILVQNLRTTLAYLGGPTVTANMSPTGGLQLPPSNTTPVNVPMTGAGTESLYGVSTAACNVAFIYPG